MGNSDVLMTLRSYYRYRQQTIQDAEHSGMPIYVLRSNTISQMENALAEMFNLNIEQPNSEWEEGHRAGSGSHTGRAKRPTLDGFTSSIRLAGVGCSMKWPVKPTWFLIHMEGTQPQSAYLLKYT